MPSTISFKFPVVMIIWVYSNIKITFGFLQLSFIPRTFDLPGQCCINGAPEGMSLIKLKHKDFLTTIRSSQRMLQLGFKLRTFNLPDQHFISRKQIKQFFWRHFTSVKKNVLNWLLILFGNLSGAQKLISNNVSSKLGYQVNLTDYSRVT